MQYTNRARETGDSAAARFTGSTVFFLSLSWGLRPRLYSATCFAGSGHNMPSVSSFAGSGHNMLSVSSFAGSGHNLPGVSPSQVPAQHA